VSGPGEVGPGGAGTGPEVGGEAGHAARGAALAGLRCAMVGNNGKQTVRGSDWMHR